MKHPIRSLLAIAALAFLATAPDLRAQNSSEPQLRGDRGFVIAGLQGVASVSVGTAGTGYTSLPVVAFTAGGGGTQATGTATLKVVGTVTVTATLDPDAVAQAYRWLMPKNAWPVRFELLHINVQVDVGYVVREAMKAHSHWYRQ